MIAWTDHLIVAPVALPLGSGAMMLMLGERRQFAKGAISIVTTLLLLAVSLVLLQAASGIGAPSHATASARAYLIGDWPAPFGIVLVLDKLSALMLVLTAVLGVTTLVYGFARWNRAGPRFHTLLLFQLMGLNGAFLTGDLFNLFVFFEVVLAASYGLLLHGSGTNRVRIGLHYVAINVATSLLFLIGVSLIYGVTGTLNMADLVARIAAVRPADLALLQSGAAILGLAFLVKAGMWPLGFWLPTAYSAATPPVAALFVILSKVGIYALLRTSLLFFGDEAGAAFHFADDALLWGGMATIAFGTIGVLSSQTLSRLAGFCILISSGTLLATVGTGDVKVLSGALFYLASSTLGISAFYLLIELVERGESERGSAPLTEPVFDDEYTGAIEPEEESEVGVVIPATIAILGGGFVFCSLLLAGLPPLSGFIAKFAILDGLIGLQRITAPTTWILIALIILSGVATLIAMTRAGIDLLWTPGEGAQPDLRLIEAAPVGMLLALCLGLMIFAGPVLTYMEQTARALHDRGAYRSAVTSAPRGNSPGVSR
ncbi:monovalent cation/H+ antiporter subunit D [Sphingomonas faeni]|uniref:monovalent cation/H+ antiporter subunit D n=1 Tax=Sphingomonas faeni TaxID=185950 RepID=UPI002786AAEC|nr:monovalent cation/H+ antiporter subunit D [Sphingomonas faeni]MDQ0839993.1 multicomponent K+:H+ antiporter subunit D [Sphingomonas faeni]